MLELSAPFWTLDGVFSRIQFPWRLGVVQTVALGAIVAFLFARPASEGRVGRRAASALSLGLLGTSLAIWGAHVAGELPRRPDYASEAARARFERDTAREYRYGDTAALEALFPGGRRAVAEGGRVEVVVWKRGRLVLDVAAEGEARVSVRQFDAGGWRYESAEGGLTGVSMPRSGSAPVATLTLPAGDHRLVLSRPGPVAEGWGAAASLLGLLAGWRLLGAPALDSRAPRRHPVPGIPATDRSAP
jgi:hypothetical protein